MEVFAIAATVLSLSSLILVMLSLGRKNDLRNSQFGGGFINADTVNTQHIGDNIWNFFFGQQLEPVGNPAREHNQRLLLAQVKHEVAARLEQSLHNAILINLGKELQPQHVKRPWDAEIKIGLKPPELLPENTSIVEVFDRSAIAGRLLILGAPGSGKTTTQLELAQVLIKRAEEEPDYPIPVLLNLSSWQDERQSITDWLITELYSKYGVPKSLGQKWLQNRQLLPLLDGLDEVKQGIQEFCIESINQLLQGECQPQYVVVCSRREEYRSHSTKLVLNGAIYLRPLTHNQIRDYLNEVNCTDLQQTNNYDLRQLIRNPFFLSLIILIFQEISTEDWQQFSSNTDRNQHLLDAYVSRMLNRYINSKVYAKKKSPNARQTRLWLVFIAKLNGYLVRKTDFSVENIINSMILRNTCTENPKPNRILFVLIAFFSGVNCSSVIFALHYLPIYPWLINSIIIHLFLILDYRVIRYTSLVAPEVSHDLKTYNYDISFNKAIWNTIVYSCYFGIIYGIIYGIIIGIISVRWLGISGLISGLFSGLIVGLILGLTLGTGSSCVMHFSKHLSLYFNGYIPWNYARFLDYCTERMILQRVGGRYSFIHKMLQDHFAQMSDH